MTAIDAAPTVDASLTVAPILISLVAFVALYVWTALALSAVFAKSGEEGWKAWVPVLNIVVLLQLGGLSGWLVLVALVPVLGALALWVIQVIACYRINVAFGFGAGMTVLAALLLPVWATVLGFGSARWVGAEKPAGVRRSAGAPDEHTVARGAAEPAPPSPIPPATAASVDGWAPATAPSSASSALPAPPLPSAAATGAGEAPEEPISFVPLLPSAAAPSAAPAPAPAPASTPAASDADLLAQPPAPAPASGARANQGWGGFDLGVVVELTSEVTEAVAGAPSPVSAVGRDDDSGPAVTRVPASRSSRGAEPWAPSRSPFPETDVFPEASGEVSAVVGAPQVGIPRSARGSVSAQHVRPDAADVDHTVVANRRRAHWSLILPNGSPVDLVADIVMVGRRPAPNSEYPSAQIVVVDDGTVSKTHLRLDRDGDGWSVTDLHSTNGTLLIASDGAEREIVPGAPHRASSRLLLGDAELRLAPADPAL